MILRAFSLGRKHTTTICDAFDCALAVTYQNRWDVSQECRLYESKIGRYQTIETLLNTTFCGKVGYKLGKISKPFTFLRAQAYLSDHDEPETLNN